MATGLVIVPRLDRTEPTPACELHDHARSTPPPSEASYDRAARLFRAMGDVPRLRILELLRSQELCVTEIVSVMNEKFPTVSQRLRMLRSEGLIRRRRDGNHLYYSIADQHVADLIRNALDHARELDTTPERSSTEGDD